MRAQPNPIGIAHVCYSGRPLTERNFRVSVTPRRKPEVHQPRLYRLIAERSPGPQI